jgi:hypothetical protein
MEIIRHKLPPRGEGLPIISRVVKHGNTVYVCGTLPEPIGDVGAQTKQVLDRIDEALSLAGTDKSKIISAQVWLAAAGFATRRKGEPLIGPAGHSTDHDFYLAAQRSEADGCAISAVPLQ